MFLLLPGQEENMRNIINRTETVKVSICESITCNCCGKEFQAKDNNPCWANTIHSFNISFGYGSRHDMDIWTWDLCEDCIEEIVSKFKIPVKIHEGVA